MDKNKTIKVILVVSLVVLVSLAIHYNHTYGMYNSLKGSCNSAIKLNINREYTLCMFFNQVVDSNNKKASELDDIKGGTTPKIKSLNCEWLKEDPVDVYTKTGIKVFDEAVKERREENGRALPLNK
jgi:hypothetical protein